MASKKEGIIDFTFDAEEFKKGIDKSTKDFNKFIGNMDKKTAATSKTMKPNLKKITQKELLLGIFNKMGEGKLDEPQLEKAVESGVFAGGMKLAAIGGLIKKGIDIAIDAVKEFVPEIGQAMNISREIIMKNLFWPLRQAIMPELQKMLDWVKNHRATFVKWGGVIVNVFQFIKTGLGAVWKLVKPIVDGIKGALQNVFGKGSFTDMINVILFKLTAAMIYVQHLLQPLFGEIGKTINILLTDIGLFFTGFANGVRKSFSGDVTGLIESVVNMFSSMNDIIGKLTPAFKVFGDIMGRFVGFVLTPMIEGLKLQVDLITQTFNLISGKKDLKGAFEAMGKSFEKSFENVRKAGMKAVGWQSEKVDDVIISAGGRIIKPSPQDTIYATKGGMGGVKLEIGAINITVTEGNAQQAGMNFVGGMDQKLRNMVNNNLLLQGAH